MGVYSWEAELPPASRSTLVSSLLIVTGPGESPQIPVMPAWIAALLVLGVATVLAIRMPKGRGR